MACVYLKSLVADYFTCHVIVAHSFPEFGIGKDNALVWFYKEDMHHFRKITSQREQLISDRRNIVVFGRKTWEGISEDGRESILKTRVVIVISSNIPPFDVDGNEYWCSWDRLPDTLLGLREANTCTQTVFFAGGQTIYEQAFRDYPIRRVHVTEIYLNKRQNKDQFDTFFPSYRPDLWLVPSPYTKYNQDCQHRLYLVRCSPFLKGLNVKTGEYNWYRHKTYADASNYLSLLSWVDEEKKQYLEIMREIMTRGSDRDDRTGTGTRAIFSSRQVYDLADTFPMITTRRQWLKGIFEELKLYLSGETDNRILQKKGIHIWDGNTSREFLNSRGLDHYPEGDMGETYGFNFRHFGGDYVDCEASYDSQCGYDQLKNVIHLLKTDPTSRRMIINLWNPATVDKAALPSCLMLYQFFVDTKANRLNCQIYIRSSDYFLANNWNCCTGALFVHMLCALEDIPYTPGFISVITGDTHIYKTHFEQVKEQLTRNPVPFPKLTINTEKKYKTIDEIEYDDLWLIGYQAQPSIEAPMAV